MATTEDRDHWGARHKEHLSRHPLGWLDNHYVVKHRVFPMLFGSQEVPGWWEATLPMLGVPSGGRWLDLGCGAGNMEIDLAKAGMFDSMLALDASPGSIDVAKERAHREGVTNLEFGVADANEIDLDPESFDVVHITMALHHVRDLEHVVHQINRALKPGGVFVANDYVGPTQFQFSDERMAVVNGLLATLPDRLRWNPVVQAVKESHPRYSTAYWDEYDPTEAVRSADIPRVLAVNFPQLRRHDYGGNVLNLLLENIVQNFDPESPEDLAHLERMFAAEDELLRKEPSDFAIFVCPRGHRAARLKGGLVAKVAGRRSVPAAGYVADDLGLTDLRGAADVNTGAPVPAARPVLGTIVRGANGVTRRAVGWFVDPSLEGQRRVNHGLIDAVGRLRDHATGRIESVRAETDRLSTEVALLRAEVARLQPGAAAPVTPSPADLASLLLPFHRPVVLGPDAAAVASLAERGERAPVLGVATVDEAAGPPPGPDGLLITAAALPGDGPALVKLLEAVRGIVDPGGQVLVELPTDATEWGFPDPVQLVTALAGTGFAHPRVAPLDARATDDLAALIESVSAVNPAPAVARAFVPFG